MDPSSRLPRYRASTGSNIIPRLIGLSHNTSSLHDTTTLTEQNRDPPPHLSPAHLSPAHRSRAFHESRLRQESFGALPTVPIVTEAVEVGLAGLNRNPCSRISQAEYPKQSIPSRVSQAEYPKQSHGLQSFDISTDRCLGFWRSRNQPDLGFDGYARA